MPPAARYSVPPSWLLLALVSGLAGCYSPPRLQEGAPCERSEQCPDPQHCVLGSCSLHDAPPVDADPPPPDAMADAAAVPIDAMPLPCVTTGLSCNGGTATMFSCGGHCWVKCTAAVQRETARAACAGWNGALGEIDDAAEEACVTSHISTLTFWTGAIQDDAAATPDAMWTWNGVTPIVYTSWATGKPDDADGVENGIEQCADIRPGGAWDDDGCGSFLPFFCERP